MDEYFDYNIGETFDPSDFYTIDDPANYWPVADYSNEGRNYPTPESTQGRGGSPVNASTSLASVSGLFDSLKGIGGKAMNFAGSNQGIMAIIAALAAMADRRGASGGGTSMGMPAPRQFTRTITPGAYGPIARYAAEGGLMQAYAHGGEAQAYAGGKPLMMEDGGFVFTEKATKALGPQGIASLGGKMISAPGNGTDDKGVTGIIGKHGVTPARVSNKESYFPKEAVQENGGPKRMYAAMNKLQRNA